MAPTKKHQNEADFQGSICDPVIKIAVQRGSKKNMLVALIDNQRPKINMIIFKNCNRIS